MKTYEAYEVVETTGEADKAAGVAVFTGIPREFVGQMKPSQFYMIEVPEAEAAQLRYMLGWSNTWRLDAPKATVEKAIVNGQPIKMFVITPWMVSCCFA